MPSSKILIIEDSPEVADLLLRSLRDLGFQAEIANCGAIALRRLEELWDLVILDLTLPDLDGAEIQDVISAKPDPCPVLILTARDSLQDKVTLFQRGCDDYLTKPFALAELALRVKALLKRPSKKLTDSSYIDLTLTQETSELRAGDKSVILTPKEFALCKFLLSRSGEIISRHKIIHSVWGLSHEPNTNYFDVHLANLRKKFASLGRETWLKTFRGLGISLRNPELSTQPEYGS